VVARHRLTEPVQQAEQQGLVVCAIEVFREVTSSLSDAPILALAPERRAWGSDRVFVA
jgi:hypothetical protein